jgi:hypothetical protein
MKIEVLAIDGMSLASEAWRLSRDVTLPIEWSDIYTVDSPCNEMPSAFCHFHDFTILEREIFASSRTHVMWARTSFVDSPDKYQVPEELARWVDRTEHASYRNMMDIGKSQGQHQDEWRRWLPLSASTAFVMRLSYRDAIKYAKYFVYLQGLCTPVLKPRFNDIAEELLCLVDRFTGDREMTEKAADLMSLSKFLNEEPFDLLSGAIADRNEIIVASFEVPLWIRAHFVRHRPITIVDDFMEILKMDDVLDRTIETKVLMNIAASTDIWRSLLGKRSCWLTQSTLSAERDPWQEIIDKFAGLLGHQILPCADGVCPYHRDARNRLLKTDPGVPCPRYITLNLTPVDAELAARIDQALKSRGRYWTENYRLEPDHPATGEDNEQAAV